jgi:site-specific recombinase XerD
MISVPVEIMQQVESMLAKHFWLSRAMYPPHRRTRRLIPCCSFSGMCCRRSSERLRALFGRAKLTKRVTSHTFRHSFATQLLQANYDIRTIQTLLGHSDVRTTMIYTHCVPSKTIKELKSPLDL